MATYDLNTRQTTSLKGMAVKVWKAKDENSVEADKPANRVDYPKFLIPQEPDLKPKQVFMALVQNQGSYTNKVGVGPSLKLPNCAGGGTWTYTRPKVFHIPHIDMYKRLVRSNLMVPANLSATMVRCNNNPQAMVTRLQTKLTTTFKYKHVPDYSQIHPHLFCHLSEYNYLPFNDEHPCFDNINPAAEAGMPYAFILGGANKQSIPKFNETTYLPLEYRVNSYYLEEPIPIKDHAMHWANKFRFMAEQAVDVNDMINKFKVLINEHPELNTFIAKRKDERISREEYGKKVRMYGVSPSALKLFFKWCAHPIETTLVPFFENVDSCSAYHFSFF